jgi:hypothetical protein
VFDAGRVRWLGGPNPTFDQTVARGISESGAIVGAAISDAGEWRGCVWKDGKARLFPDVEGTPGWDSAIDSKGGVIAIYALRSGVQKVYAIRDGKVGKAISTGDWRQFSHLYSNDRGETAGDAVKQSNSTRWAPQSVVLIKNGVVRDLGRLSDCHMRVRALSPEGVIVGDARRMKEPGITLHAFMWDEQHGLRDLNTLLPAGMGWVLQEAHGVDANGAIYGIGQLNGKAHFYRLTLPAGG